jgi:phosphatidylinositol-3-phosphatase
VPVKLLAAAALAMASAVTVGWTLPVTVVAAATPPTPAAAAASATSPPAAVRHVFVINLENKGFRETFGPRSPAPYLSKTLRGKGQLLRQYYAVAHNSLVNYIAQVSGQAPNNETQAGCHTYTNFVGAGSVAPGQAVGHGCVFPSRVTTVANQLAKRGLTWKGYMESMHTPCRHPALNTVDRTQKAKVGDQYVARHNPFVYFHSIIDSPTCARHDVGLKKLPKDLARIRTTANLTYITPDLCNDAHDSPCVDGRHGGLVTANHWLHRWVPKILASPAYRKNGLLVVTFDEADVAGADSSAACCGEVPGPNSPLPGINGPGGGRIGAVLVSPFIKRGSVNDTAYNHYSLLRTIEDLFQLAPLGYAADARSFGRDVFGAS